MRKGAWGRLFASIFIFRKGRHAGSRRHHACTNNAHRKQKHKQCNLRAQCSSCCYNKSCTMMFSWTCVNKFAHTDIYLKHQQGFWNVCEGFFFFYQFEFILEKLGRFDPVRGRILLSCHQKRINRSICSSRIDSISVGNRNWTVAVLTMIEYKNE